MGEVVANGIRLAFDESGDGDPLLFIGGTGMPGYGWASIGLDLVHFVEAGHRVVTFDSRGVGASDGPPGPYTVQEMAADTADLIDQLDLAPCRLVGLSLGGFIVEELSVSRPELVHSAVLWASAGPTPVFMQLMTQASLDLSALGALPASYYLATELVVSLPFKMLQNDDASVAVWAELFADESIWSGDGRAGQLAADYAYALDDRRAARWADIECPCLVIAHEHDLMFPPRGGREAADAMPRGAFLEIPGISHGQVAEAAPVVQAAISDFLARPV